MSIENVVFRKIKEISARDMQPRPEVAAVQIARELSVTMDNLAPCLAQLKQLRLLTYCDAGANSVRLTLLGTVVTREK
jgi:hypothetical protein